MHLLFNGTYHAVCLFQMVAENVLFSVSRDVYICVDELSTKYNELSSVREELVQQLNIARDDERTARANVNATEQTNCTLPSYVRCLLLIIQKTVKTV